VTGGFRPGVRLGVDVGDVRIGVARSDPSGLIATPVETVRRGAGDLARLRAIAEEEVGLPRSLSGGEGPAATKVRAFARMLAGAVQPVPVRLCDERLSTVTAESVLRGQGKKGQKRRAVVDQAAAVVILQNALDTERATGVAPGEPVSGAVSGPVSGETDEQRHGDDASKGVDQHGDQAN
jgi:putative holliday junction resolvase